MYDMSSHSCKSPQKLSKRFVHKEKQLTGVNVPRRERKRIDSCREQHIATGQVAISVGKGL